MDTQTIIILFCIGIVAGMLSGVVGIGGGIIIVPALVFFLGFSQLKAQGTSLGILLLPVGILAVIQFYKQGYIDMKTVGIVACSFVVGGYLGSKIALALPQETVKKVFAVLLLLISIKMFFFDKPKTASVKTNSVTEKPV